MDNLFYERIQSYIPDEYDAFLASMDRDLLRGLRANPKKIHDIDMQMKLTDKSPFCKDGWYVSSSLGNHPYHIAGAFYLQEPSAGSAVDILDVKPDDIVLDLCAAPGGKSTQIAASLKDGFLVSNEYDARRSRILLSNMERMGVMNMCITNSETKKLCDQLTECFDKVLVDAPCSGEGMIKKHEAASANWSIDNILFCAARQKEILTHAYEALKKDGVLVYSTCTYAKEENEDVIAWFLETYPDMVLEKIDRKYGRQGLDNPYVKRIFPMDKGEGHFVARLRKTTGSVRSLPILKSDRIDSVTEAFLKEQLTDLPANYMIRDGHIYAMNHPFLMLKKIPVIRQGILLGERIKNRFEPAHAFYMNADWIDFYKHKIDVNISDMDKFMHGLELDTPCSKGYTAVCMNGIPFGFGKSDGKHIKNKIPKGLRLTSNQHVLKMEVE